MKIVFTLKKNFSDPLEANAVLNRVIGTTNLDFFENYPPRLLFVGDCSTDQKENGTFDCELTLFTDGSRIGDFDIQHPDGRMVKMSFAVCDCISFEVFNDWERIPFTINPTLV